MSRFTTSAPLSRREVIRDAVTTLGGRRHRESDAFTVLTRDEMQGIAERALQHSTADGCEITITSTDQPATPASPRINSRQRAMSRIPP